MISVTSLSVALAILAWLSLALPAILMLAHDYGKERKPISLPTFETETPSQFWIPGSVTNTLTETVRSVYVIYPYSNKDIMEGWVPSASQVPSKVGHPGVRGARYVLLSESPTTTTTSSLADTTLTWSHEQQRKVVLRWEEHTSLDTLYLWGLEQGAYFRIEVHASDVALDSNQAQDYTLAYEAFLPNTLPSSVGTSFVRPFQDYYHAIPFSNLITRVKQVLIVLTFLDTRKVEEKEEVEVINGSLAGLDVGRSHRPLESQHDAVTNVYRLTSQGVLPESDSQNVNLTPEEPLRVLCGRWSRLNRLTILCSAVIPTYLHIQIYRYHPDLTLPMAEVEVEVPASSIETGIFWNPRQPVHLALPELYDDVAFYTIAPLGGQLDVQYVRLDLALPLEVVNGNQLRELNLTFSALTSPIYRGPENTTFQWHDAWKSLRLSGFHQYTLHQHLRIIPLDSAEGTAITVLGPSGVRPELNYGVVSTTPVSLQRDWITYTPTDPDKPYADMFLSYYQDSDIGSPFKKFYVIYRLGEDVRMSLSDPGSNFSTDHLSTWSNFITFYNYLETQPNDAGYAERGLKTLNIWVSDSSTPSMASDPLEDDANDGWIECEPIDTGLSSQSTLVIPTASNFRGLTLPLTNAAAPLLRVRWLRLLVDINPANNGIIRVSTFAGFSGLVLHGVRIPYL